MPTMTVKQETYEALLQAAEKQHKRPETLLQRAVKTYLQQLSDDELLEESMKAARQAPFRIEDTEEVIRQFRKQKRKQRKAVES